MPPFARAERHTVGRAIWAYTAKSGGEAAPERISAYPASSSWGSRAARKLELMNWSLNRRWLRWVRLGVVGAVMAVGLMVSLSTSPPRPVRVIPGAVEDLECSLAQQSQLGDTYTQVLVVPGPGGVTTVTLPVGGV